MTPGAFQRNWEHPGSTERTTTIMELEMNKRAYKTGNLIKNKAGLTLQVTAIDSPSGKTIGDTDSCYKTVCTECGYIFEKVAENLEKKVICNGCITKTVVLKFDADSEIISIIGYGMDECIGYLEATHDISESEAISVWFEVFEEAARLTTEGSINSKVHCNEE
jgi:hypothetical protein